MEGVALRELIDEQKEAMRLDVRGEETFEFVVVVLDAFREELSSPPLSSQFVFQCCATVGHSEKWYHFISISISIFNSEMFKRGFNFQMANDSANI